MRPSITLCFLQRLVLSAETILEEFNILIEKGCRLSVFCGRNSDSRTVLTTIQAITGEIKAASQISNIITSILVLAKAIRNINLCMVINLLISWTDKIVKEKERINVIPKILLFLINQFYLSLCSKKERNCSWLFVGTQPV